MNCLKQVNNGLLTPGFMGLYVVFLCWCAIRRHSSCEPPDSKCIKKVEAATKSDWLSIIVIGYHNLDRALLLRFLQSLLRRFQQASIPNAFSMDAGSSKCMEKQTNSWIRTGPQQMGGKEL
ncbi:hypothetical protein C3L33_05296, partial [Rhododendron williamsianum]